MKIVFQDGVVDTSSLRRMYGSYNIVIYDTTAYTNGGHCVNIEAGGINLQIKKYKENESAEALKKLILDSEARDIKTIDIRNK